MVKKLFLNLCYDGLHSSRQMVDQWYHFVMTNEVTEFNINFSNEILTRYDVASMPYEFPHIQPISKSLECLKLSYVKILDFSIEYFATKCPLMKDLTIVRCFIPLNFMVCKRDIKIITLKIIRCFS
ncbi:unnamed protein product [Lathyrus oleraceus]